VNLHHAHEMRLSFILGVIFKISDDTAAHFYMGASYPPPGYTRSQTTVSPVINTSLLAISWGKSNKTKAKRLHCFFAESCNVLFCHFLQPRSEDFYPYAISRSPLSSAVVPSLESCLRDVTLGHAEKWRVYVQLT